MMLPDEYPITIRAHVEDRHRFMEMLCTSATAEYRSQGGEIFCKRGCSRCCTLAVNCTAAEALLIAESLTEQQKKALSAYVDNLKKKICSCADLKGYLRMIRTEMGGCPFLDHGSCGVYPTRPLSCRALLSTKESRWCDADFSNMSAAEKQSFIDTLDRPSVAFPMHYLACTQKAGQTLEAQASLQMLHEFGFSLYGNLPVLVYLFSECDLWHTLGKGADTVLSLATTAGLDSPFLLQVESG